MNATRIQALLCGLALWLGILTAGAAQAAEAQPASTTTNNSVAEAATDSVISATTTSTAKGIRLTFRSASLETVLSYLSEATDFIINIPPGTAVNGRVDVLSSQPLSKDEAYDLLNTVLNQNGLAAIRNGRTLTIVRKEEAKTRNIPVVQGNDPKTISPTDEMVTQIIGIRYANALQLIKDLQPLLASYATLTANESANALVLTGTRADVRRTVEIVRALDTSISSISTVRVFPLKYADAKTLADTIKQMFQAPTSQQQQNIFRGGPGGGDPFAQFFQGGGQNSSQGTGDNVARQVASRVIAVGDDRSNSLVVSGPNEYMSTIEKLVHDLDQSANDVTEIRVFHLKNADPQETVDELTQLFPDSTKSGQQTQQFQFGGPGGGPFGPPQPAQTSTSASSSDRMKKMGQVLAVADNRTKSVIVSAASQLMPEIAETIAKLDDDATGQQHVYVIPLENAEVADVLPVLQDLFNKNTTTRNNRTSSTQNNNALTTRTQNNNQNQGRAATSSTGGRTSTSGIGGGTGF
jgi:type II secretory pathway component GspD/PulD (secretin)